MGISVSLDDENDIGESGMPSNSIPYKTG